MQVWDSPDFASGNLWLACGLLFLSGIIMLAGGAGGGGVFVAVFISVLSMTAHEAVPLSKFVILLSAICTFVLNSKKNAGLIDYVLVRSIVPLSLAGTLIGVLINTLVSDPVLLIILCVLQSVLLLRTGQLSWNKYRQETKKPAPVAVADDEKAEPVTEVATAAAPKPVAAAHRARHSEIKKNIVMASLVPVVVVCGVFASLSSLAVRIVLNVVAVGSCLSVSYWFYRLDHGLNSHVLAAAGFVGGVAAGLFGIGGGLVYSPVMLRMGVHTPVVIAVSSTGVLFASASTAMQYLFMGRIPVFSGLLFSVFGIMSAVAAVFLVRYLAKKPGESYRIFLLVTAAVALSLGVTLAKTITTV